MGTLLTVTILLVWTHNIDVTCGDSRFCEADEMHEDRDTLLGAYPCYDYENSQIHIGNKISNNIKTSTNININVEKTSICEVENESELSTCSSNLLSSNAVHLPFFSSATKYGFKTNFELIEDTLSQNGYLPRHQHKPINNFYTIDERWFRLMIRKRCQEQIYKNLCDRHLMRKS